MSHKKVVRPFGVLEIDCGQKGKICKESILSYIDVYLFCQYIQLETKMHHYGLNDHNTTDSCWYLCFIPHVQLPD